MKRMLVAGLVLAMGLVSSSAAAYEEVVVTDGGELTGTVKFVGAPPRLEPLRVAKNRDVCGETKEQQALVVDSTAGVAGSVVMIEGVSRGNKADGGLIVDNHNCLFAPRVSAAMTGVRAWVKNSDPILHNTHGRLAVASGPGPTLFNLGLPILGQTIEITRRLIQPGPVRLLCDSHPHMLGWIYMHDSPYITVTNEKGVFRIGAIPAGRYRVTMWHEPFRPRSIDRAGFPVYDAPPIVTREVVIAPRATANLDFELR
jgi:hypothetical protein